MVSADKILDAAIAENADVIGLSGLITPSLEEMVNVASEMERRKMKMPLLIGGATTSEVHTAVKVAPAYSNSVIHVRDASKAAGVLSSLIRSGNDDFTTEMKAKYDKLRETHNLKNSNQTLISLADARGNKFKTDWENYRPPVPAKLGTHVLHNIDLKEVSEFIDWTMFFSAWKLSGRVPTIFDDAVKGEEAKKLFADAQEFLQKIIDNRLIELRAVFGLYPAVAVGDSVKVEKQEFTFLRNQEQKPSGTPNLSLSDFIAPESSGVEDYIGAFAVTATPVEEFGNDDYSTIMLRILCDRFAEATAEWLHFKVRTEYWGFYRGIRPAPGYPACPDHTEKRVLFDLLEAEKNIGAALTENFAITPPSAVCGYFFSHPNSAYFNIEKIDSEQPADYAKRKNFTLENAKKWLATNL
jgi:5-methyltetrahydrofolate--homocysteine methyltransferase